MVPERNPDAAGIVALALAFHRAPTQYADLLHGRTPLPPGVGTLLKLAGGSEPDPEHAALARPDELKAAALFFIEQALFHHDASHYRVLGLEPGASLDHIKEHHRLLMRVFHPDRENRADDWKDAFATRINLAYTALRDPDARRRYDATFRPSANAAKAPSPSRRHMNPARRPLPDSRFVGLPPVLLRYLPQWVLAGIALIACLAVWAVYLKNPHAPATARTELAALSAALHQHAETSEPTAERQKPDGAENKPARPVVAEAEAQPAAVISPSAPVADLPKHPARHDLMAPRIPSGVRHVAPYPAAATKVKQAPLPPAAPMQALTPPRADAVMTASASGLPRTPPAAVQAPVVPPPAPAAETAHPAPLNPDATLARFMSSYERGDTQAFMALFDDLAIGNAGGKRQIRREHEALFQSTELRHIEIDGMAWSQEGDWLRGTGHYRITLMHKGELQLETESGIVRIEFVRRGDRALIMGLDYQPGART